MKRIAVFITILLSSLSFSQPMWRPIGPDDSNQPSTYSINYCDLAVDLNGVVYTAYCDQDINSSVTNKISVRRFINNHWEQVGIPGFSAGNVETVAIAVDYNNIPYVVYKDVANGNKATVQKFNGNEWVNVGTAGFTTSIVNYTDIAIDHNNVVYIVCQESGDALQKAVIRKFNGTSWEVVGTSGISISTARYTKIAISDNNIPFVAYSDGANAHKLNVKKFNGTTWEFVGTNPISSGESKNIGLAIDNGDLPYIIYTDVANSNRAIVKKFDGNSWSTLGNNIAVEDTSFDDIVLDSSNNPSIIYFDALNSKCHVKKYNGSSWDEIASADEIGSNNAIAIDEQNHLYTSSGDLNYQRVKKYTGTINELLGTEGIVPYVGSNLSLAMNGNNIPYITYAVDGSDNLPYVKVKKLNATVWEDVDTSQLTSSAYDPQIFIDQNDIPYLYFTSNTYSKVYKLSDIGWQLLPGSFTALSYARMTLDYNNIPYVVTTNTNFAKVRRYDTTWSTVGSGNAVTGEAQYLKITTDHNNVPYIAYSDVSNGRKLTVRRCPNNNNWIPLGSVGFSSGVAYMIDIKIDHNNVPYVAYVDVANNYKAIVKKFNETAWAWETVGNNFSSGSSYEPSITFDNNNVPYLIYRDDVLGVRSTNVRRFNGTDWELVGEPSIFKYMGIGNNFPSLVFTTNNVPYVLANTNGVFAKYFGEANTLQTTEQVRSNTTVVVSPNPINSYFSIITSEIIKEIELYTLTGKLVFCRETLFENIDTSFLETGIYILKVKTEKETITKKLIKN